MKVMSLRVIAPVLIGIAVSSCSGGGTGTSVSGAPPPPATSTPNGSGGPSGPTPPPLQTFAYHFLGIDNVQRIGVAPANSTVSLPPGYTYGGPVANAIVTYPDGSAQQTNASGVFTPAASTYAGTYMAAIGTQAVAQPVVKVADPLGGAIASTSVVTPFASSGGTVKLGGVTVLPDIAELFPGEVVTLVAVGSDVDDNTTGIGSAQIAWNSANGATITPIPGTNQATYVAPTTVSSGSLTDVVTATVTAPGASFNYTATSQITTIANSSGFAISGTLSNTSGAAIPGGSAIFVAQEPPRAYPSFNFSALANASGSYQRYLPANAEFSLALSVPTSGSTQSVFLAMLQSGESSVQTGAAGTSGTANLQIASSGSEFDDSKDDANNAIPDPVVTTRDGWFSEEATRIYPFWADSGVLGLLSGTHVDGGVPAPVGSGLLARWCYQWQARSGGDVLVLVENTAAACTSPGNDAFEISSKGTNTYSLVQYRSLSGAYALSGTLNDSANALLVASGTWSQSVTMSGSSVASDSASVTLQFFGPISQTLAAPVSQLSMQYAYSFSGGAPAVALTNVTLTDPSASTTLASASSITLTQNSAPASCAGGSLACYTANATVTRYYALANGSTTRTYSVRDILNGDGSGTLVVNRSLVTGNQSSVVYTVAPAAVRAAGSCIVCASGTGQLIDVDGTTQLGSFTVSARQLAAFNLLDTVEGSGPGTPIASLGFPLN
jgi:hypothetical protein